MTMCLKFSQAIVVTYYFAKNNTVFFVLFLQCAWITAIPYSLPVDHITVASPAFEEEG